MLGFADIGTDQLFCKNTSACAKQTITFRLKVRQESKYWTVVI